MITSKQQICFIAKTSILIVTVVMVFFPKVYGAEQETSVKGLGFTFNNHLPENQLSEGTYFDLLVTPNQRQVLITELRNETDEEIEILVSVTDAQTTESGTIDYSFITEGVKDSEELRLTDLITVPKRIVLPKKSKKNLELIVNMPDEQFLGVILGGIKLEKVDKTNTKNENEESTNSFSIRNKYAYVFSISLRESLELTALDFETIGSTYQENDGRFQVLAKFSNRSQRIITEMEVTAEVTAVGNSQVISQMRGDQFKMAPNSSLTFPIDTDPLPHGEYQTEMIVKNAGLEWKWTQKFTVANEEQAKNQSLEEPPSPKVNWLPVIILVSVIIFGTFILYLVISKKDNRLK